MEPQAALLLVEDEPGLVRTLGDRLRAEGYRVTVATDGDTALAAALRGAHDLIVLDVMLPGRDGFAVLRGIREQGVATPVLMLTARDRTEEKVRALRLGADDYLTKPFRTPELLARLEALLRRARGAAPAVRELRIAVGDWVVDLEHECVTRGAETADLSRTEFELLVYLARRRGHVVSREELLRAVWRYAPDVATRTVDQHVAQLRRKLEPDRDHPRHLLTVARRGYLLKP